MDLKKTSANFYFKAIALALALLMICPIATPVAAEAINMLAEMTANTFSVSSPDESLEITLSNSENGLSYTVTRDGETIIEPSAIGINTNEETFASDFKFESQTEVKMIDETYTKYSGSYAEGHNYCNERSVTFSKGEYLYTVILRAYNDGIAFRSEIAYADGEEGTLTVTDEKSSFVFPAGTTVQAQEITSLGGNYSYETASYAAYDIANTTGKYLAFAALCQVGDTYVLVNEADLYGDSFYGSCFYGAGNNTLELNPAPVAASSLTVAMDPEFTTPWRYAIIGDLKTLVESDLTENLNPAPAEGSDFSWVEPGVTAWTWMTSFKAGQRNEQWLKKYIDLAAEMGWKYIILDEGWQPDSTVSGKVYDGYFDYFDDMVAYADSVGVGFVVWVKYVDLDTAEEREILSEWADKGIKGIKADFFDSEAVDKIDCLEAIYKKCAEEKLLVNIHGGNKPTGERRTWPNVINRESIHGQEWNEMLSANTTIWSYTRGIIGPADVTPYIYPEKIGSSGTGTFTTTTAHQIALNVIVESGMPCMASSAEDYQNSDFISFFKNLPARWDDLKFLEGNVKDYTVLARKSASNWFVAGVSVNAKDVTVSLDFLDENTEYVATVYADETKTDVVISNYTVTSGDDLSVSMINNGGFVIMIRPADETILPEEISFDSDIIYLEKGKTAKLNTTPSNADVSDMLVELGNEGTVHVNKNTGVITALKSGVTTVKITCPITGASATAEIRVTEEASEDGNTVYDILYGEKTTVLASKILGDGNVSDLDYVSVDPTIATVDENGTVTAVSVGVTTVIATNPVTGEQEEITVRVYTGNGNVASTPWSVVNGTSKPPVISAVTPNKAEIPIATGDLYASLPLKNLLLIDAPDGDFTISVKVEGGLSANYESIGLVAFSDYSNMVVMERRYHSYLGNNIFGLSTYTTKHNEYCTSDATPSAIAYLKMEKKGNVFTGYYSYDGNTWTAISTTITSAAVAGSKNLKIGLVARSGGNASTKTAVFYDFKINENIVPFVNTTNDSIWEVINPEANSRPIVSESNTNLVEIKIPTGDIYSGRPPQNVLAIDAPEGDFELTVEVSGGLSANYESIGLIAYHDNSNMVTVERRYHGYLGGNLFGLSTHNGSYTELKVADANKDAKAYLKLVKAGTVFTGFYSYDGISWTQITGSIDSPTVANSDSLKIGLVARSGSGNSTNTAVYQNFCLNGKKLNFIETHTESIWEIENPTVTDPVIYSKNPNSIEIAIPMGNIDGGGNTLKNLFLIDAPKGDFELTVKVSGGLNGNFESIGLIAFESHGSVVTVERRYHPYFTGKNVFGMANYNGKYNEPYVSDSKINENAYLKMIKVGNDFTGYYRYESDTDWTKIGAITSESVATYSDLRIGIVARAGDTASKNTGVYENFTLDGETIPFYHSRIVHIATDKVINAQVGGAVALPETAKGYTATGQTVELPISWDISNVNTQKEGKYTAVGSAGGIDVEVEVNVSCDHNYNTQGTCENCGDPCATIIGANVALGESININYYVDLDPAKADAKMRFTFNGKEYYADAVKTDEEGVYTFTFKNIAPQCMGDNIKAELIVDGNVFATKEEYSVLANVTSENVMNDDTKQLIYDLLAYGAAAQQYAQYKTDSLVNAGYEELATPYKTIENSDRVIGEPKIEGAEFYAVGVYHANTNKIYAKIKLIDSQKLDSISIKINNVDAEIEAYDEANGIYIVYTEEIKVTEFDKVFTFVLSDGAAEQTVQYSVNAYCAIKQNAENTNTAALARAMYAYGMSAEALVNG